MTDLKALLDRLQAAQRDLLSIAAKAGALPSENTLRKIADLEIAIGAVEGMIESGS